MPMDLQLMDRPPLPLVARRITKWHIREFVLQYQRHRASCETREGREDEAVNIYELVDDTNINVVCCRAFPGRLSMDGVTEEEDILEALRGRQVRLTLYPWL